MVDIIYEPWGHYRDDKSNSEPYGDEYGAIYGVELEIGELEDAGIMESLISDGLIECSDTARAPIQLEYEAQSDVEYELVFNADSKENILTRLEEIQVIRADCYQHRQCSCHIHSNRYYIENVLKLDEMEFFKAAEAVAPFIYGVSGRDYDAWTEWTPSKVSINENFIDRFNYIDEVKSASANGGSRYELCNLENTKTLEIRGFSNYFNFDIDAIALYLDIVSDLIPAIALKMKGKRYKEHYVEVIAELQRFIKKHRVILDEIYDDYRAHSLDYYLNFDVSAIKREQTAHNMERAIMRYQRINKYLEEGREYMDMGNKTNGARVILNLIDLFDFEIDTIDLNNLSALFNAIEEDNQRTFKNAVWRA